MKETYATYKVWHGCDAPSNLQSSGGHLCGQIVSRSTVDRDELLKIADEMRYITHEDAPYALKVIANRIREACGVFEWGD